MLHVLEGGLLVLVTVFLHGAGMLGLLRALHRYRPWWEKVGGVVANTLSLTGIVGSLVVVHLLEIGVWACFFTARGVCSDLETASNFSLATYTTVGYGDVVLPAAWRVLGTVEALVGTLMTAWSTAILISVVQQVQAKTALRWKAQGSP